MPPTDKAFLARRGFFPRGLSQPAEGFRFSADALLLACFAAAYEPDNVLDLGTGCGVVGLGLLLRCPSEDFSVLGIDHDPEMIQAAENNAKALGFDQRFTAVLWDICDIEQMRHSTPGSCDLVVCNPPYRPKGHGRMPVDNAKRSARFETSARMEDFTQAAAKALKTRGRLALVHLPEHLGRIMALLQAHDMEPKRLRFVHGHGHKPASLLLLEARKAARPGLQVEPPLVLYRRLGQVNALTEEALAFCPFLRCNDTRPLARPRHESSTTAI